MNYKIEKIKEEEAKLKINYEKKKLLFIQILMRLKRNCITFLFKEKYSKQRQRKTLSKNENTMNIDYINFENGEIKNRENPNISF